MSEFTLSEQLVQHCHDLEQALVRREWEALSRLDQQVQATVNQVKATAATVDAAIMTRLKTFYPAMIAACQQERSRLAAQLRPLQASKSPLRAYHCVAMINGRNS